MTGLSRALEAVGPAMDFGLEAGVERAIRSQIGRERERGEISSLVDDAAARAIILRECPRQVSPGRWLE